MSDIELVIKIPKRVYNYIRKYEHIANSDVLDIKDAIINGILLPKGHGRIADIDKVLEEMKAARTYDIPFALERVKPIIEADKEHKHE